MNNENNGFNPLASDEFVPVNPNELSSGLNSNPNLPQNNVAAENTVIKEDGPIIEVNNVISEPNDFISKDEVMSENVNESFIQKVKPSNVNNFENTAETNQNNVSSYVASSFSNLDTVVENKVLENVNNEVIDNEVEPKNIENSSFVSNENGFNTKTIPNQASEVNNAFEQNTVNTSENSTFDNEIKPSVGIGNDIPISENVIGADFEKKTMSKKKKIIMIVIGVILALAIAGLLVLRFYFNNPYNLMTASLDKLSTGYTQLYDKLSIDYDLSEDILSSDINFSFDVIEDNTATFSSFDGVNFNINAQVDYKNEQVYTSVNLADSNESIDLQLQYLEEIIYISLGDLFESTISYNLEGEIDSSEIFSNEAISSLGNVDYSILVSNILDIYVESFDKSDAETDSVEIDYFNDEIDVTMTTYVFDKSAYNDFIDALAENDDIVKMLATLLSYEESEVIDMIKNGEFITYQEGLLDFNVYTKGILNSFVGFSISSDESVMYLKNGNESQIILKEVIDGEDFVIEMETESGVTSYEFELIEGMDVTGQISENKFTIGTKYDGLDAELSFEITESTSDKTSIKVIAKIAYDDGYETFDVQATANITNSTISSITNISNTNVVNLEDLTDEDLEEIITNLTDVLENSILKDYFDSSDLESILYDEQTLFLKDAEIIAQAAVKALEENEETCYNLYKLYAYDYVDYEMYSSYYAVASYDEENDVYYISVADVYNDYAIYKYVYKSGDSISEDSLENYSGNYSFSDFYYCD